MLNAVKHLEAAGCRNICHAVTLRTQDPSLPLRMTNAIYYDDFDFSLLNFK